MTASGKFGRAAQIFRSIRNTVIRAKDVILVGEAFNACDEGALPRLPTDTEEFLPRHETHRQYRTWQFAVT